MFEKLASNIAGKGLKIVYPEATDPRVLGAAVRLKGQGYVDPILLGRPDEVKAVGDAHHWDLSNLTIVDPSNYDQFDEMVASFVERRNGKATEEQAREILKDYAYFGTMLVHMDQADGLVCGAVYSTSDTVRPALQIIKTREDVQLTSGAFLMVNPRENGQDFIFADCAININPDAQQLAEIAVESARTAEMFGIEPRVAMLSFSTKGSANSPEVEKVVEATRIAQELAPDIPIDGEMQFDAAIVPSVAEKKTPGSDVAGQATVFVFPEIQSGNIGYKIAQRFGGFEAIGPILQGMNKPISDLSRGTTEEDVFKISIITANQALMNQSNN